VPGNVIASRWPKGFECPVCGATRYSLVTTRHLYQCAKCRRQTSPGPARQSGQSHGYHQGCHWRPR
jgi:ribosomal protein L37AE/L43A